MFKITKICKKYGNFGSKFLESAVNNRFSKMNKIYNHKYRIATCFFLMGLLSMIIIVVFYETKDRHQISTIVSRIDFKDQSYTYMIYYHRYGQKAISRKDIISFLVVISPKDKITFFTIAGYHLSTNNPFSRLSRYFSVSEKYNENNTKIVYDQFSYVEIDRNSNISESNTDVEFLIPILIDDLNKKYLSSVLVHEP
jgi:hypothetical protein